MNDDPELIVTYFTSRSHLVPKGFEWENFTVAIVLFDFELQSSSAPMTSRCQIWPLAFLAGES